MSYLTFHNAISSILMVGAIFAGLGLTARAGEQGERPEVQDLAGMTQVRGRPGKGSRRADADDLRA
jgi:hypothetical protein